MNKQVFVTKEEIEKFAAMKNLKIHTIHADSVEFWYKTEQCKSLVDGITCCTNKEIKSYITKRHNDERGIITGSWVTQKRPYIDRIKENLKKDFLVLKNLDNISFFRQPVIKKNGRCEYVTGFCNIENKLFKFKIKYIKAEDDRVLLHRNCKFISEDIISNISIEPKTRDNNMCFFQSVLGLRLQPLRTESIFHKEKITEIVFESDDIAQQFLELVKKNCKQTTV